MLKEKKIQIIRAKDAYSMFAICRASFYNRINDGLIPAPINLGGRAVGWVESEIISVLKAMIAGKNKTEIKEVVKELVENRQQLI